jgi:EAL and modified HD-GYP domain-containing signal transduction protein
LLAEKVETLEEYEAAMAEGFDYFQGYFFGRPVTQGARKIPHDRVGHMRLLGALQDPELTVQKLEQLIQHDASLCYRVLRTVNSAAYGQRQKVESIRQAMVLMGVGVLQRWLSLWALAGMGAGAHPELLVMSTVRARCCEILASNVRGPAAAAQGFLLGLCSLLDAILEQPLPALLEHLPLTSATHAALQGEDNPSRRLLDCAIACERGDWEKSLELAERAGISASAVAEAHREALRWFAEFQKVA